MPLLRRAATAAATVSLAALLHIHQSWGIRQHKPLWPLDARDYAALAVGALALICAALGGTGGGGLLLPLFVLVLAFPVRNAVALSNATILGGAIANVLFATWRRHPYADRPIIAWSIILLFEPMVLFGSVLGAFGNKLLPDVVLQVILVLLYGSLSYRTMRKGIALVHAEGGWRYLFRRAPDNADQQLQQAPPKETTKLLAASSSLSPQPPAYPRAEEHQQPATAKPHDAKSKTTNGAAATVNNKNPPPRRQRSYSTYSDYTSGDEGKAVSPPPARKRQVVRQLKAKERRVQKWKPAMMTLCFAGVAALRIGQKQVDCGSWLYWVLTLAIIPWVLPFFVVARRHVLRDNCRKARYGYPFPPGDVRWNRSNTLRWPAICSAAGVMSGMLGSSGGTIKAPLLLELGMPPTVVSSTVAQMILYTSATSSLALLLFGVMPIDYGGVLLVFGMLITAMTDWAAARLLGKRRKQSLAMMSIALVITVSTVSMGTQAVWRISRDPTSALEFGALCGGRGSRGDDGGGMAGK